MWDSVCHRCNMMTLIAFVDSSQVRKSMQRYELLMQLGPKIGEWDRERTGCVAQGKEVESERIKKQERSGQSERWHESEEESSGREKDGKRLKKKERWSDLALLACENCHLSNVRPVNGGSLGSAAANYIIYSYSFAKMDTGMASKDWSKVLF